MQKKNTLQPSFVENVTFGGSVPTVGTLKYKGETYITYKFTGTGTITLSASGKPARGFCLVIGGGGAGGAYCGGGGGAGGYQSQAILIVPGYTYSATIGAGGAASFQSFGQNGTASAFYGPSPGTAFDVNVNGGQGGGTNFNPLGWPPTATTNTGGASAYLGTREGSFAGGAAATTFNYYPGGGGGGTSAAGSNASGNNGGDGGAGTVWLDGIERAGGGGGGTQESGVYAHGIGKGGGGNGNMAVTGLPGTPNTGGGGGGNAYTTASTKGGLGGSGVVILAIVKD